MSRVSSLIGLLILPSLNVAAQVIFPGAELLGRPTDHSVTINVVPNTAIEAYFEYGLTSGGPYLTYPSSGAATPLFTDANTPLVAVLNGLASNTRYFYRMVYRQSGAIPWATRPEHSFQTQRPAGSTFTFTITSDSHLNVGGLGNPLLFQQTMQNVAGENPDFHLDLGDTFPMDNVSTQALANNNYLTLRSYFGLISHSAPILLVIGNHEQTEAWHLNDTGNPATSPPVLSANARNRYYLNPSPLSDSFYSGNTDTTTSALTGDHSIEDYYAWHWGDALFVVIDPYWYSTTKPFVGNIGGGEPGVGSGDRWDWTLGIDQYRWLKQTLENSTAKFKFIFAHQVPGGTSDYGRGGANAVPYVELGGYNLDGTTYAFDSRRPGWPMPVHQLLVTNHVTAFFHGHDHEFAYEKRDGVIYQAVPMAADVSYGLGFQEYHETDPYAIRVLPNSGHLRVTVSPSQVTVDYVRTFLQGAGTNGQVAYSFTADQGVGCSFALSAASKQMGAAGGPGIVTVAAPSGCAWTAVSNAEWLSIASAGSGVGTGAVSFLAAPNTTSAERSATLTIAGQTFSVFQAGTIFITDIRSATDYGDVRTFTSGSWLQITGSGLAPATRIWQTSDFNGNNAPTNLDGIVVLFNGIPGFLYFTKPDDEFGPSQINVQAPAGLPDGPVQVQVLNHFAASNIFVIQKTALAPGMLSPPKFNVGGKQYLVATYASDYFFVGTENLLPGAPFRPAKPGDILYVYGIGFGDVTPYFAPGVIPPVLTQLNAQVQFQFGPKLVTPYYAGFYPNYIGLDLFGLVVPDVPDGDHLITVLVNGQPLAQTLYLTVKR